MTTQKSYKNPTFFCCEKCDYNTLYSKDYKKHLMTLKHKNNENNGENNTLDKSSKTYCCEMCSKIFNDRAGLWRHKNKNICEKNQNSDYEVIDKNKNNETTDKELIIMLIKQNSELIKDNSEFKNMVMEQQNKIFEQQSMVMKVLENGTNNTTTINSHNKAFNLNFFLNETCKDAMNIMDFVETIKLQLSDLERVGEKGYIEGISNIIIKNLKDLDITQRPVHCTDKKRETIYVKDEDKWEKDDENKKMHKLVRKVQDKNFRMIQKFKEKYPNYYKASSKESDVYNNIIIESMGGKGDNDFEKEEKIIKKVSKEIGVGK